MLVALMGAVIQSTLMDPILDDPLVLAHREIGAAQTLIAVKAVVA